MLTIAEIEAERTVLLDALADCARETTFTNRRDVTDEVRASLRWQLDMMADLAADL